MCKEEIVIKSPTFMRKWGSFYSEFKINKGFWSSQYYLLYFTRRFIYLVCQIYLNQVLYLQCALQVFCSAFSLVYLFYYKPFKDLFIYISVVISEICVFIVFMMSLFFLFELPSASIEIIENFVIGSVLLSLAGQFIIGFIEALKAFKKAWDKIQMIRMKSFLKNAQAYNKDGKTKN